MQSTDQISGHVQELVRQRGIDPLIEVSRVAGVVEQVVDSFLAAAPDGDSQVRDRQAIIRAVTDEVAGFGPLQRYLDDDSVEEIWINSPTRIFIARNGRSELTTTVLSAVQVRDLVERMLSTTGRRLDMSSPFVDAALPDGSRLHVVIPDVTRSDWVVNIRKHICRASQLSDLVDLGVLPEPAARFLEAAVVSGLNVLVAGGTQAGKTTALNALLGAVPGRERIVTCEETFELQLPNHPDWVAMQTRQAGLEGTGEISLRTLVKEALRMRPSRLVVGEVRQQEAMDLLIAMNSGMPAMASLHANSSREAVTKLCTLPLLAGSNISADFVVPTVAGCVDVVVHLETASNGRRRATEVVALSGRVENGVIELSPIFETRAGRLVRADGFPPHVNRFEQAGFDLQSLLVPRRVA